MVFRCLALHLLALLVVSLGFHKTSTRWSRRQEFWLGATTEVDKGKEASSDSPPPVVRPPVEYKGSGPRVYTPRSDRGTATSTSGGGATPNRGPYVPGGAAGSSGPPRVYNVRPSTGSNRSAPAYYGGDRQSTQRDNFGGGGGGGGGSEKVVFLNAPQLLIRYRVPREKSDLKKELEELQESFREQSEASRQARGDFYGGAGGGGRYGGGGGGGGARDSFFDNFQPAPAFGDQKKGGAARGKGATKEGERKGSEGSRPKSSTERNSRDDGDFDEEGDYEDSDSLEGGDMGSGEMDADYYGDESNRGLSSVSAAALRNMETEGFSLEEMQMALYGEYGVKASVSAIKRRLVDDQSDRKRKKKTGKTRRDKNKARNARFRPEVEKAITLEGPVQVVELAGMIGVGGGEVVKHLMMNMGIMSSMTQTISLDVAKQVVKAFGKSLAGEGDENGEEDEDDDADEEEEDLGDEETIDGVVVPRISRPAVVTIMGHVDHGKTSLLDSIRKTQVALGEAGGITQGISAFKVRTNDRDVTFIDTPGHAAFSEMRKRGANVTDIIILVVAADDGIMEQTKECIVAAKTAGCPIVVCINKIDKEGADPQAIITGLMSYDILVEEFGGEAQCAQVSAKQGIGIDELLDKVLIQAEIMNLKSPVECQAEGTVIEASVSKGLGVIVTCLVQKGTLKVGDFVLAGPSWGRVRRILSDQGKELKEAGPSTPVQIVGMSVVPNAGDVFTVSKDENGAREVAEARQRLVRQAAGSASSSAILAQAMGFAEGNADVREIIKVPLVIKADVAGSVDALRSSIDALQISDEDATCKADIVFSGVGDVTSSDVAVAAASKAKVIAFNVAAASNAMNDARASNVQIGYYSVVYELLDEIEAQIRTTLAPPPPGTLVGKAEIKKIFKLGKVGKVAGVTVLDGVLKSDSQIRIMRGKRNPVYTGKLTSLKVVKDDVSEVPAGSECGCSFDDFQDFEENDIIECFVGGEKQKDDE